MYIKKLYISAFGPIMDTELTLSRGLNIIEGDNESGKSAVAMFIKFMLYGLSGRASDGISERQQYVSWTRGLAAGWMLCVLDDGKELRIERRLTSRIDGEGKPVYSDSCTVIDEETNMPVSRSSAPGSELFGIPEQVFTSTAFSAQSVGQNGDIRPDSAAVKESIENIVSSADENVSVKKAADILEKARVRLRHKRGQGGDIYELERQREELAAAAERSMDESARIIKNEMALDETRRRIVEAKAKKEELDERAEAIQVLTRAKTVKEAMDAERELREAEAAARTLRDGAISEELSSAVAVARSEVEKYGRLRQEYAEKDAAFRKKEKNSPIMGDRVPSAELELARTVEGTVKKWFIAATVFLSAGLLLMLISIAILLINDHFMRLLFAGAAALVVVGVVFLVLNVKARGRLGDILDDWNADSMEELEEIAEAEEKYMEDRAAYSGELDRLSFALDSAEGEARAALNTIRALAVRVGAGDAVASTSSPTELIEALELISRGREEELREAEQKAAAVRGRLEELNRQLGETGDADRKADLDRAVVLMRTEAGQAAAAMTGEDISEIARAKKFTDDRLETLRSREAELDRELAALRAVASVPAGAEEKLSYMDARIEKLEHEYSAYMLAISSLHTAGERVRSGLVPRITGEASKIMSDVTAGKYDSLSVTPSLEMSFRENELGTMELDRLSAGTRDAAYIALRIALVRALFEDGRRPPLVFDESLCRMDSGRVKSALSMLSAEDVQVLLFTCRALEGELAGDIPHSLTKM